MLKIYHYQIFNLGISIVSGTFSGLRTDGNSSRTKVVTQTELKTGAEIFGPFPFIFEWLVKILV